MSFRTLHTLPRDTEFVIPGGHRFTVVRPAHEHPHGWVDVLDLDTGEDGFFDSHPIQVEVLP